MSNTCIFIYVLGYKQLLTEDIRSYSGGSLKDTFQKAFYMAFMSHHKVTFHTF